MQCPSCGRNNDKVTDSRPSNSGDSIRRRRQCKACGKRFSTVERVERSARLTVVKRGGARVPFSADNVMRGIVAACGKRPISAEAKEEIVRTLEDGLYRDFEKEVPSVEIGRRVAQRLRGLDDIAYIRFASEHEDFRTIEDIAAEVKAVQESPKDVKDQTKLFDE